MSEPAPGLHLTLPATSENVAVVRHAVAGLAETLGMDEVGVADLKTVVTEACMNVVVHAYVEGSGPIEVEAESREDALSVSVRDFGAGIRPRAELGETSLRLGLSLIAALSRSFEISGGLGRGTCVAVEIPLASTQEPAGQTAADVPQVDATRLAIREPDVLGPVLARIVGALAARREVTIDRLADALLLTDAISADAPSVFADGRVKVDLSDAEDGIDLRLGPMETGAGERLRRGLALPDVGGSLEMLADELKVEQNGEGDFLVVRFSAQPA